MSLWFGQKHSISIYIYIEPTKYMKSSGGVISYFKWLAFLTSCPMYHPLQSFLETLVSRETQQAPFKKEIKVCNMNVLSDILVTLRQFGLVLVLRIALIHVN